MKRLVRRKPTMAGRVRDFTRTYPSTDASWTGVVSRLEELLARAGELEQVERQGRADRRTASATRREAGTEKLPAEPSGTQGLLPSGGQDDEAADTPDGEGDRNVG